MWQVLQTYLVCQLTSAFFLCNNSQISVVYERNKVLFFLILQVSGCGLMMVALLHVSALIQVGV